MELSILQWNVLYQEKADNILSLIKQIDADVVNTQELTGATKYNPDRDLPKEIAALGYNFKHEPVLDITESPDSFGTIGNAVFSKYPIVDSKVIYVQKQKPGDDGYDQQNRAYVEALLDIHGGQLRVGTVHLSYTDRFKITDQKKAEADKLVEAVKNYRENFVLTGDMNATPETYTIKELGELFKSAGPDFAEPTWTTKPFSYNGFEAKTLDWRLDYVFATPDLQIISSEIIKTNFSDHLPILTKIKV